MEDSIILVRTSTTDQHPELQIDECKKFNESKGWNLVKIFQKQESAFKNEEGVWLEEVTWATKNNIKHIIVWNMDRYSRLPEERVLKDVKILSLIHGINIHAVHGDLWSEIVESVGKLKEMGFIGEAISEFLEKLLRGLEFQRANRESQTKSERVKLAVKVENGVTKSYKGNKWGYHGVGEEADKQIIELYKQGKTQRQIAKEVFYWNKNRNKKFVSNGYVNKVISAHKNSTKLTQEKSRDNKVQDLVNI